MPRKKKHVPSDFAIRGMLNLPEHEKFVKCPECGMHTTLKHGVTSQCEECGADIGVYYGTEAESRIQKIASLITDDPDITN
jgi:predicted RNA-binding Zn-ribbon protein involved in translation (DUF1610 family)